VPGIDACYIGPNDLCASMNLTPSLEPPHREVEEAVQAIFRSARTHGVAPGIHTAEPETASRQLAEGWQLVGCASDLRYLAMGSKAARGTIKTA